MMHEWEADPPYRRRLQQPLSIIAAHYRTATTMNWTRKRELLYSSLSAHLAIADGTKAAAATQR
jgi:hypothetical protein